MLFVTASSLDLAVSGLGDPTWNIRVTGEAVKSQDTSIFTLVVLALPISWRLIFPHCQSSALSSSHMAPSKRKRDTGTTAAQPTNNKQTPKKISLLLDLPPELRNKVYECALEEHPQAYLSRFHYRPGLATTSNLVLVSKQVKEEFLGMLYLTAPIIRTAVRNFDFRHIVTYLNGLSDMEIQRLGAEDKPAQHEMRIELEITTDRNTKPEYLPRWLNRVEHRTKKGTHVDFKYTVSPKSPPFYPTVPKYPPGSRSRSEVEKIDTAMRAHGVWWEEETQRRQSRGYPWY